MRLYFQQQEASAWLDSQPRHGIWAALAQRPQSRGFTWSLQSWLVQLLLSLSLSLTHPASHDPSACQQVPGPVLGLVMRLREARGATCSAWGGQPVWPQRRRHTLLISSLGSTCCPGPAAPTSPGNLLEKPVLRPHRTSSKGGAQRCGLMSPRG